VNEMDLGQVLRVCRKKAGLSQEKLAELLHMSRSCISKIETGAKEATAKVMIDWVRVTQTQEVLIAYLFGMDGISIIQNILQMSGVALTLLVA